MVVPCGSVRRVAGYDFKELLRAQLGYPASEGMVGRNPVSGGMPGTDERPCKRTSVVPEPGAPTITGIGGCALSKAEKMAVSVLLLHRCSSDDKDFMIGFRTKLILILSILTMTVSTASAQATRTWVSGVGDDANPCSRTAPCKTFAGAISKTAAGGEISVLDPGGFGTVTITKAMTINGGGTLAGILAAGVPGVIVNAGSTDTVVLRGLSIEGTSTASHGVRLLAGDAGYRRHYD